MHIFLFTIWTIIVSGGDAIAGSLLLALRTSGAVSVKIQTQRDFDDSHSCALVGPSGKEQTLVLAFNKGQTDSLLQPTNFGFSLSIPGIVGRDWDEKQPSAILQLSIGNRRFVGLHALAPQFRLRVSVDPGGYKGTFSASHLLDPSEGAQVSIEGSWHCLSGQTAADTAPSASRDDEQRVAGALMVSTPAVLQMRDRDASPASKGLSAVDGAVPQAKRGDIPSEQTSVSADKPRHFRLRHRGTCRGSPCDSWAATDLDSGRVVDAAVSLVHLKLAPQLIASARAGLIELWVTGDVGKDASNKRRILARHLDGVVPRQPEAGNGKRAPKR